MSGLSSNGTQLVICALKPLECFGRSEGTHRHFQVVRDREPVADECDKAHEPDLVQEFIGRLPTL
jgi:hypothetical protein